MYAIRKKNTQEFVLHGYTHFIAAFGPIEKAKIFNTTQVVRNFVRQNTRKWKQVDDCEIVELQLVVKGIL